MEEPSDHQTPADPPSRSLTRDLGRIADPFRDPVHDREVKRGHLAYFYGAKRVLDLGCGDGAFLDLLADAGITGLGIDASEAAVGACRERGHQVEQGDVLAVLRKKTDAGIAFGGVFASHVVEHLPPDRVVELLGLAARVLAPGGNLVVVTPDVKNLVVLSEVFWLDPTHVRPYPRALLESIGASVGLRTVASYDDPATAPRRGPLRRWLARLRSLLSGVDRSGPMDSVVVFTLDEQAGSRGSC